MENISVKKVSSRSYNRIRKRASSGITVKKKTAATGIKHTVFYIAFPVFFYLTVFLLCAAASKIRRLWQSTLIMPQFTVNSGLYAAISLFIALIMIYIMYISLIKKDKVQISSLIINAVITVLLYYMFFGLASPLGSLVIITVLLIQTITTFLGCMKTKKPIAFMLLPLLLWQIYNMLLIYTILMLN